MSQTFGTSHDLEWKRRTWIKVLESPEMSILLPDGFGTITDAIERLAIVQNLSSFMNKKIGSLKKDAVHARRIICSMVASENANGWSIAKVLKEDKRFVTNAIKCKEHFYSLTKLLWTSEARKTRSDPLVEATKELVCSWWHSKTTISPNKKDVVRKHVGVKKFIEHPRHYLQESQVRSQSLMKLNFSYAIS